MNYTHHQLRKGRVSQPDQIYLVTFCTHARKPLFRNHDIATDAVAALLEPRHWTGAHLMTWVLMPDHWHGLIQLDSNIALSQVIGRLKGASARTLGLRHPHIRPVWQDSFHDRALRAEEDLPTVAHYIFNNPVRAGLVDTPSAYPFSGSLPPVRGPSGPSSPERSPRSSASSGLKPLLQQPSDIP